MTLEDKAELEILRLEKLASMTPAERRAVARVLNRLRGQHPESTGISDALSLYQAHYPDEWEIVLREMS